VYISIGLVVLGGVCRDLDRARCRRWVFDCPEDKLLTGFRFLLFTIIYLLLVVLGSVANNSRLELLLD
jgi:hypothetical protein